LLLRPNLYDAKALLLPSKKFHLVFDVLLDTRALALPPDVSALQYMHMHMRPGLANSDKHWLNDASQTKWGWGLWG